MKQLKHLLFLLFIFYSLVLFADKERHFTKQNYDGIADPLIEATIAYGFDDEMPGIVLYTAREGTIAEGPIYRENGTKIREGDLLVRFHDGRRLNILKQKKAALKIAESELEFEEKDYIRAKSLIHKNCQVVSRKEYEKAYMDYLKALATVESSKIGVARSQTWYDNTIIRANFDCIVKKVIFPYGMIYVGGEILKIVQLNPMGINVKMSREDAYKINNTTPIVVYPFGSKKPVSVYSYSRILTEEGITLRVKNPPLPPPVDLKLNGKIIPAIDRCHCVETFLDNSNKVLSVPLESIFKDEKGEYVWLGEGENALLLDKGFDYIFPVKKIYIQTYDILKNFSPHRAYKAIKGNKELHVGDLLLAKTELPKNLKSGDKVCFYQKRYLFMPGDPVKVEISSNPPVEEQK